MRNPWLWLGLGLCAVYLRGLPIDVMDVDASQYASIAREMLQNGSWLQVQHRGADYLDKPPLLFWLSTASFSLFGVSNWAYKLPSFLGALAGIWGLYRFCLLFYPKKTARHAAFLLASSLGLMIICNDVRTDTLLLGATTCAVWQLAAYLKYHRIRHLVFGFAWAGVAMLTKGPIGLVVPGFAVATHLLLQGQWRAMLRPQWLLGLAVTALVLAPMCWGLWQQFDLHPEKTVNGRTGVSGLYFFFWEQSFGRITGENVWRNDASAFYFLHVYLWAFLPWCLLLPAALWKAFRRLRSAPEHYALGAFVLSFVALSMSQYKLPHYIFITLPWAAALVAGSFERAGRRHWAALYISMAIGLTLAFLLTALVFPTRDALVWAPLLAGAGWLLYGVFRSPTASDGDTFVQRGVLAAVLIGFVLNFHFYPRLLPYQVARHVAEYAHRHGIPADKLVCFHRGSNALDFYMGHWIPLSDSHPDLRRRAQESGAFWVYADEAGKGELTGAHVPFQVEHEFRHFQVALLKPAFLLPEKRESTLEAIYLLKILPE